VGNLIIFNPNADHGRSRRLLGAMQSWAVEIDHSDLWVTQRPGHATEMARSAVARGYDLVIAAGGDGTIHEVINGLVHDDKSPIPLGIIPLGSGNDYAYGLGLAQEPLAAFQQIFSGKQLRVDLARLEDDRGRVELAFNGIGIGFDATVSIQTRSITRIHGFAMYMLAALRTIAFYYQTPELQIQFDEERIEQQVLMLSVGVGPRIGGGFLLTPGADLTDGLLDSCAVKPISRLTMMRLLPRAMKGTHITSEHVSMRRNRSIEIISDMALPIHADGEIIAYHHDNVRQIAITSLPAALQIKGALPDPT